MSIEIESLLCPYCGGNFEMYANVLGVANAVSCDKCNKICEIDYDTDTNNYWLRKSDR